MSKRTFSSESEDHGGENMEDEYSVICRVPTDLSPPQLAACVAIIRKGNAVRPTVLRSELSRSAVLVLAEKGDEIVGVGAIKRVRPAYAAEIASRSNINFDKNTPELGYVAIAPKHREKHLSSRIVAVLLSQRKGPLFATTDDDRMKTTLKKAGFSPRGVEWKGRRGKLSLWLRT